MDDLSPAVPANTSPDQIPELAPLAGSSAWQLILLLLIGLFIFTRVIRGMQLGGPRQFISLLALIAAYITGWAAGPYLAPLFRDMVSLPDFALMALCSAGAGILVYLVVEVAGAFICRKTEDVPEAGTKRVYALSGMFLGLINGVIVAAIALIGVNVLGTIANTQLYSQLIQFHKSLAAEPPELATTGTRTENDGKPGPMYVEKTLGHPATVFLARVRNSMNLGQGQELIAKVDPVPPEIYRVLQKSVKVLSDPESTERLYQHPDINRIMKHQTVAELAQDTEIKKLAEQRDLMGLIQHPSVVAAANDPEVQKDFSGVDFEAALDFALLGYTDTLRGDMESGKVTIQNQNKD